MMTLDLWRRKCTPKTLLASSMKEIYINTNQCFLSNPSFVGNTNKHRKSLKENGVYGRELGTCLMIERVGRVKGHHYQNLRYYLYSLDIQVWKLQLFQRGKSYRITTEVTGPSAGPREHGIYLSCCKHRLLQYRYASYHLCQRKNGFCFLSAFQHFSKYILLDHSRFILEPSW